VTLEASVVPVEDELPAIVSQRYPDLAALVAAARLPDAAEQPTDPTTAAILEQLTQLRQQGVVGMPLAAAYQSLGNLYRDRIEQGNGSEAVLLVAIHAYEQLLANLGDRTAVLWSDVLNDLGNLYWMLTRQSALPDIGLTYLEAAISAYQLALTQTDPQVRSQNYAMIQNNLGSAFGDLARYRDPASTLEQSVQAYEAALRYRTAEADPARYAATQNNLGTAYWNLAQHQQPMLRLQQAIAAYHEALSYYTEDREPLHYAMIQNNLGTAYWNLAQYEPSANGKRTESVALLNAAVRSYTIALTYRTMEVSPAAHAATQNNLGTAHWHLANLTTTPSEERRSHLQEAIEAYKAALAAVQFLKTTAVFAPLTFDPFATQNNLGLAYYLLAMQPAARPAQEGSQRVSGESRSSLLDLALQHHLQALQGWEKQPEFYEAAIGYVAQTLRALNSECGMNAQNQALSKIPANLLPDLMKRI
jgi:tetratricopeptide (TPR) repeat protein